MLVKLASVTIDGTETPTIGNLGTISPALIYSGREQTNSLGESRYPLAYKEYRGTLTNGQVFANNLIDVSTDLGGRPAKIIEIETDNRILVKFNSLGDDTIEIKSSEERIWDRGQILVSRIYLENNDAPTYPNDAVYRIWVSA